MKRGGFGGCEFESPAIPAREGGAPLKQLRHCGLIQHEPTIPAREGGAPLKPSLQWIADDQFVRSLPARAGLR